MREGSSAAFTLDKGLTILGIGPTFPPVVAQDTRIDGIPAAEDVRISNFRTRGLLAQDCLGTVVLDSLTFSPSIALQAIRITSSEDVRISRSVISTGSSRDVLRVEDSRVEVAQCDFTGGDGNDESCGDGGWATAAWCEQQCRGSFSSAIHAVPARDARVSTLVSGSNWCRIEPGSIVSG